MISIVMNSWKRPDTVKEIMDHYEQIPFVDDVIIWNNNKDLFIEPSSNKIRTINTSADFGLSTRWAQAIFARNECIVTQDDDHMIPSDTLRAMHEKFKENPTLMQGVRGRNPKSDNTYAVAINQGPCHMVMTGFAIVPKKYCLKYFDYLDEFTKAKGKLMLEYIQTHGDDLFMSYLAMHLSGKKNLIHNLPYQELPVAFQHASAIHLRPGHYEKRSKLMVSLQEYFGIPWTGN